MSLDAAVLGRRRRHDPYAPLAHREFPLVRRQHPDHGDGGADPGGGRRLADVRRHARSAGAGHGRAGRGGAVHRLRAATPGTSPTSATAGGSRSSALVLLFACAAALAVASALLRAAARHGRALDPLDDLRGHRRLRRARAASCCRRATRWAPTSCRARSSRAPSPGAPGIWQVAAVTGPALGGLLYAWVGADARPTRSPRR